MKKVFYLLVLLGVTFIPNFGFTQDYWALGTGSGVPKTFHEHWMKGLPDSMRISELSIPGTHDAGTEQISPVAVQIGGQYAICQDGMVADQLLAGVRFLDLRVTISEGVWVIHHSIYNFRSIVDVLNEIDSFLKTHPSETVLVRLTADDAERDEQNADYTAFVNVLYPYIVNAYSNIWQRAGQYRADGVTPTTYADQATSLVGDDFYELDSSYYWPTLGEVRGKMVMFVSPNPLLIQEKGHTSGLGYNSHYPLTDNYTRREYDGVIVGSTRDQYDNSDYGDKQTKDFAHINAASADRSKTCLYVTGLNIGATVNLPITHAGVMNRYLLNWLNYLPIPDLFKKTGIVLMDFPGPGLLDSIIALNFRHNRSASSVYPSFYSYANHLPAVINSDFQYQAAAQARALRRMVKERIPSTEFNTFVAKGTSLSFSSSITITNPTDLSTAVGPFGDPPTMAVLFNSHNLPSPYTTNQVQTLLGSVLATNVDVNIIKRRFDAQYPSNQWTVFSYATLGIPPSQYIGLDWDKNVVFGQQLFWNGTTFLQYWVAGSCKPNVVSTQESTRSVVGQWEFPYPQWTNALVGSNLAPASVAASPDFIYLPRGTSGIRMSTGSLPNGGPSAIRMHQWTLVMDIIAPSNSLTSLIQIDSLDNSTDGEVFMQSPGGIGVKGQYFGTVPEIGYHRVVVAVDATQEQLMSFYIDGSKVGEIPTRTFRATGDVAFGYTYSEQARWSLGEQAILFGDNNGESGGLFVGGVQLRNYKMSDAEVARLGGVTNASDRIPNDNKKVFIDLAGRPELQVVNTNGFQRMTNVPNQVRLTWKPGDVLQSANSVKGPYSDETATGFLDVSGDARRSVLYPSNSPANASKFYRVR